jgi:hypothetical protein
MKTAEIKVLVTLITCVAMIINCHAQGSTDARLRVALAKETTFLRKCSLDSCPVFYVSALNGSFPIPTRYELLTDVSGRNASLRFVSPHTNSLTMFGVNSELFLMGGAIDIGLIDDLRQSERIGSIKLLPIKIEHGIKISKMATPQNPEVAAGFNGNGIYVLEGKKDYLSISDCNGDMLELLLAIFQRVNDVPPPRSSQK